MEEQGSAKLKTELACDATRAEKTSIKMKSQTMCYCFIANTVNIVVTLQYCVCDEDKPLQGNTLMLNECLIQGGLSMTI